MHDIEHWRWWITGPTGKPHKTRHTMTEADALATDSAATRVDGSRVVRTVPDGVAEHQHTQPGLARRPPRRFFGFRGHIAMNGPELSALRRLLFFSTAEAARYIAADEQRPHGVEERTWNRWETGKQPVPPNIAAAVRFLVDQRRLQLQDLQRLDDKTAELDALHDQLGKPPLGRVYLWQAEAEDSAGPRLLWRVWQSALAAHIADNPDPPPRLIAFDAQAFARWRLARGLPDDDETRDAWAEAQAEAASP
jgi:hypothetical protein